MLDLIFDLRVYIAKMDECAWFKLYLYDDAFNEYSKSELGIKVFKMTFMKYIHIASDIKNIDFMNKDCFSVLSHENILSMLRKLNSEYRVEWAKSSPTVMRIYQPFLNLKNAPVGIGAPTVKITRSSRFLPATLGVEKKE